MLILSRVAAEFPLPNGQVYKITGKDLLIIKEAPDAIKETLLYKMLFADGSIEVVESRKQEKELESDPMRGIGADGKAKKGTVKVTEVGAEEGKEEVKRTRRKSNEAQKQANKEPTEDDAD